MLKSDAVIVGGGVIGCSIAYHLAKAGLGDTIILEKEFLASKASGICPGGIRQQWSSELGCRLSRESAGFFGNLEEELRPETPMDFVRSGYLFLAHTPETLDHYTENVRLQNRLGVPSCILPPGEIQRRVPDLHLEGVLGGAYCGEDGFMEDCNGFTNLLALRAKEGGARIIYDEALEILRDGGAVAGIRGRKHQISTGIVVNAAGCDSAPLAATVGVTLPVTPGERRLLYTTRIHEHFLGPCVAALDRGWGCKQLQEGVLYMAYLGEDAHRLSDLEFTEKTVERGLELFPRLADTQVMRVQRGYYDLTPDGNPVLGGVDGVPGYYQATGFNGHGYMISPAVGRVMTELVREGRTSVDITPWHLERFEGRDLAREGLVL